VADAGRGAQVGSERRLTVGSRPHEVEPPARAEDAGAEAGTTSYFLTARMAARRIVANKSGVIMIVTALPSRTGTTLNGGYGPAMAAKEALTRDLSAELAPQGIRVVGLRPHGIPETPTMKDVFELKRSGITYEQFQEYLARTTHPRRVMTLAEVANVAVFMASDKASGMTGTTVNLTMGSLDD